jgi:EmrB/QacA subfamily drug resistance transporter
MTTPLHRWRAFALLAVAFFITIADLAIVNVALPTIGRDLHFSESNLQWVVTAYGLTFGGLLLLGGRAADLLGRRRVFMVGLVIFTLASLACGLSTTDWFLIGMRGVQGVGAAIILPAALSIVMNMFPEGAERNKALGLWGAVGATGATFGVLAGGLLTRYVGWEYIFFLNVPIGVVAFALTRRLVPESRLDAAHRRLDVLGATTVTGGLLLLVYTISKAPDVGWGTARTISLLVASFALLVAFLWVEARAAAAPLMPLRIFKLQTLTGANVVGFLLGGSFFAFIFIGTLYMQQVLHYSAIQTGLAWLATSVTSVAFAGLSQALVTRRSPKLVMALGMALIGAGLLWTTQVGHGSYWTTLFGPFFVTGIGTAFAFIPISIAALAGVEEHEAGLASGLINTSQQLGGALGVAVSSTVVATHTTNLLHTGSAPTAALAGGLEWAFWLTGFVALAGVVATLVLVRGDELSEAVEAATAPATA